MISLNTLKNYIQDRLNAIAQSLNLNEYVFSIVADTGEYQPPIREDNTVTEYINGVFTLLSSDVANLTDGTAIVTQNCSLQIAVRLTDLTSDEEYNGQLIENDSTKLENIRHILSMLTQETKVETLQDNENNSYLTSIAYQFAQSGQRGQLAFLGDSFTFSIFAYFWFVENGLNSRQAYYTIDGIALPYQSMSVTASKTLDANIFANTSDGLARNISLQRQWSASLEFPFVNNGIFDIVYNQLTEAPLDQAHILKEVINNRVKYRLVTIGEATTNFETIKNIGASCSLFDAPLDYSLVSFSNRYSIYQANTNNAYFIFTNDGVYYDFVMQSFYEVSAGQSVFLVAGKKVLVYASASINTSDCTQLQ